MSWMTGTVLNYNPQTLYRENSLSLTSYRIIITLDITKCGVLQCTNVVYYVLHPSPGIGDLTTEHASWRWNSLLNLVEVNHLTTPVAVEAPPYGC